MTLVIALASLGTSYACWSQDLTIKGAIDTGEVDVAFGKAVSNDPRGETDPGYDKDVATTEVTGAFSDKLTVSITNAYPCYTSSVEFTVRNKGTIPVKIKSINIDSPEEISADVTTLKVGKEIRKWRKGVLHIHVNKDAGENENYVFNVTITAEQWNS
jgi:hypothetical protein